jgi:hypothetical protein
VFEILDVPKFVKDDCSQSLIGIGITSFEATYIGLQSSDFCYLLSAYSELAGKDTAHIPTKYIYEKQGKFVNSAGILQEFNPIFKTNDWHSELDILLTSFNDRIILEELINFGSGRTIQP